MVNKSAITIQNDLPTLCSVHFLLNDERDGNGESKLIFFKGWLLYKKLCIRISGDGM